jgi:N-acetylglucosaminyl-diphospho-decaprenol L-rhamnosyltransferase
MNKSDVTVIIVTYNSENHIRKCLDSVLTQRLNIIQDIIIVDNNSSDDTVEIVSKEYSNVNLIKSNKNMGFAAGVNLGASLSMSKYLLLLNPDTVIVDHSIDVIYNFAEAHTGNGIYGGRTLKQDGSLEPSSCWGKPTLWSLLMFALGLTTVAPRNSLLDPESMGKWQRDSIREVGVVTGCFLLCSRYAWTCLEGMDENYFMYGEDVDFCIRAHKAGFKPLICPDAILIHDVGQSSESPVHKSLLLYRGKASLIRNHWNNPHRTLGMVFLLTGTGLRALMSNLTDIFFKKSNSRRWQTLWRERSSWQNGYNHCNG